MTQRNHSALEKIIHSHKHTKYGNKISISLTATFGSIAKDLPFSNRGYHCHTDIVEKTSILRINDNQTRNLRIHTKRS